MPRPREFDIDDVLETVTELFWRHGFDKTSFADIEQATGLRKGSLFAAFGDKEDLFCEALRRYQKRSEEELKDLIDKWGSPLETVTRWLLQAGSGVDTRKSDNGCFYVNSLVDKAPHDSRCAELMKEYRGSIEKLLMKLVEAGVEKREFRKDLEPCSAAKYIFCVAMGLRVAARAPERACTAHQLNAVLDLTLNALKAR